MNATPIHDFTNHAAAIEAAAKTAAEPKRLPKVYVALCSRDWMVEHYTAECVRNFGRQSKCEIYVGYMANDGVARARNNLAAHFLESDCTHLLFLDNDIIAMPRHLDRLLAADKGIVAGFYPKKQAKLDWVANYLPNETVDENGVIKVKHAGTGFMLIARWVLEKMAKELPHIAYGGDPSPEAKRWDFFPMHAKDGHYKSEDWYFCEMAAQCGISVYIDTKIQLRHIGKIVYPLQFTLSDEDCVDLLFHRYGITQDLIRTFIGSGTKPPGLMGGHTERFVRLWPKEFPVGDLHQGAEIAGCYDFPGFTDDTNVGLVLDIGADVGAFAIHAAKRWSGSKLVCFEERPERAEALSVTVNALKNKHPGLDVECHAIPFDPDKVGQPKVVKIDVKDRERDMMLALNGTGKLLTADYIAIRYYDDAVPMFADLMLQSSHFKHAAIQYATGGGILKYISRQLTAQPEIAKT